MVRGAAGPTRRIPHTRQPGTPAAGAAGGWLSYHRPVAAACQVLIGRIHEQTTLGDLLDDAAAGRSGGLALVGDAGIGKTALLRWLRHEATDRGFTCLDTVGPGRALTAPWTALAELLAPLRARLDQLDESGLLAALLSTGGATTAQQLVAATFLRAVTGAAEEAPVLVVVDDAQWIDDASAATVATLARRIELDRVAVVVASRRPLAWWHPTGRPELTVSGLDELDALALLADRTGLDPTAARRCWAYTGGNPLALLAVGPHWRNEPGLDPKTLPQRLQEALDERLAPAAGTERALLALALDRTGDETVLAHAISQWERAVDLAMDAGILDRADGALRFSHPLLRARLLERSTTAERRATHAALAAAATAPAYRHARAWHLADALSGPDDRVAALLAEAGWTCRQQGATQEALEAYRRAAAISTDAATRAGLLIDAADMAWFVGDHRLVDDLLDEAARHCDEAVIRGRIAVIRGQQRTWLQGPLAGLELLRREAGSIASCQPALAAACLGFATFSALVAAQIDQALEVSEQAVELASGGDDPGVLLGAHVSRGLALILAGRAGEADPFLEPVEALAVAAAGAGVTDAEHLVQMVALAHTYRERWERARELFVGVIERGRRAGASEAVAFATAVLSELCLRTGRWVEAYGLIRTSLDDEWGAPGVRAWGRAVLARACAALGREEECRTEAAAALEVAQPMGLAVAEAWACSALGLLELGSGRPEAALVHLDRVAGIWERGAVGEPGALWWEGDHLDALVACGERERATERLAAVEREAERTGAGYAVVVSARGRALLAGDEEAETRFTQAVGAAEAFCSPFELARTLLARAAQRRRVGHPGASGDVERASTVFEALGAAGWVRVARGPGRRIDRTSVLDELTPAELRVAMAVARGLTNREASIDLCVSPKTVDYHLGNIYRKLGVRTRTEMTARLLEGEPTRQN